MGKIVLNEMRIRDNRIDYWFDVPEELKRFFKYGTHLFVQYDRDISGVPEGILIIPFVSAILPLSWLTDTFICIPALDSVFFESALRLREAYRRMYPCCPLNGGLLPTRIEDNRKCTEYVGRSAQMYTSGMDAMTTFIRHREEKPLLIQEYGKFDDTIVADGNYERDERSERAYQSDRQVAQAFAESNYTKATFIRSNYCNLIPFSAVDKVYSRLMGDTFWHGIQHAVVILGVAVPVAYAEGVGTLYIASSNFPGRKVTCASDPTTDNEFRFANCQVHHDGYELTDEDKAQLVVNFQRKTNNQVQLRVCSWNDHNCCACEKCLRRMLQISAEGGDPHDFGFSYPQRLLEQTKGFMYDNVQFMTELNIVTWKSCIARMQENYDNVFDKRVADFLRDYDFEREKKKGLWRYYRRNFFSIIKRKIKGLLTKGK